MFDAAQLVAFVGGLGAGSVITALVQHWLTRRSRKLEIRFAERKAAFDGLLSAYAALAEGWTDAKAKQFALWETRVQLVSTAAVVDAIARLKVSEPGSPQRTIAHDDMIEAMRRDLEMY